MIRNMWPNLVRGELYRVARKKSLFVYLGALVVAYLLVAFIRSGGFTATSAVTDAMTLFGFLPAFAGVILFTSVYTDDLDSRNLIALVGFGLGKARIVVTKLVVFALLAAVVYALVPLLHGGAYALLGAPVANWWLVYASAIQALLMTVGCAALAGILVYGLQKTTLGVLAYVLLALGVVASLLSIGLKMVAPWFIPHLLTGVTGRVFAGLAGTAPIGWPLIEFGAYVVAAVVASTIVFTRKEMEF